MFSLTRPIDDPVRDSAKLIGRVALVVLLVLTPGVGIVSHQAIFTLLPVGCVLVLVAAWLGSTTAAGHHLRSGVSTNLGLASIFLLFWAGLSLVWTAYPGTAFERFFKVAGTAVLAALVTASLPDRTKTSNLYLLPIGLTITAALAVLAVVLGPLRFTEGSEFNTSLQERTVITLVLLVWPALGVLCLRDRWMSAASLAVVVALVAISAWSQVALAAMALSSLAFAAAMTNPQPIGRGAGWAFAVLIIIAPTLPLLLALLLSVTSDDTMEIISSVRIWADLVRHDWPRFITGHGLDMAMRGVRDGFLPTETPQSILFELWYDLGALGAIAFAIATALAFFAAGRAPPNIAPALLGGLIAGLTIAVLGLARAQLRFVTLCALDALAFALLIKGIQRAKRPTTDEFDALPSD